MVTCDGGGDGNYNTVSVFKNNKLKFLSKSKKIGLEEFTGQ